MQVFAHARLSPVPDPKPMGLINVNHWRIYDTPESLYRRPTKLVGGIIILVCFGISILNPICMLFMAKVYWFSGMALSKWPPGGFFSFRTQTLDWHWTSSPNFKLFVYMLRSTLIFSNGTIKMTARRPYWSFKFPDSNYSLTLNIKSKRQ